MIDFFGYAFGRAGPETSPAHGPLAIKNSKYSNLLEFQYNWKQIVTDDTSISTISAIKDCGTKLIKAIQATENNFCVFGGDHTSAIATIQAAKSKYKNLKLIYVDAHMDLHNIASSHSQNIHGMSLAISIGQADGDLKTIHNPQLSIKPEDVCLFGIRSYEPEEKARLNDLGIQAIYMQEILENGLLNSWNKALDFIGLETNNELMFSIDLDAFDPEFSPAVTVPEVGGIDAYDFCESLILTKDRWQSKLIGSEIVEFSPTNDTDNKTEKLIFKLLNSIYC